MEKVMGHILLEELKLKKENEIGNQPKIAFKGGGPHCVGKVGIEKNWKETRWIRFLLEALFLKEAAENTMENKCRKHLGGPHFIGNAGLQRYQSKAGVGHFVLGRLA